MAKVIRVQDRFDRMVRDVGRHQLPEGACWNIVNAIPDLGAPLAKRGGYTDASPDLSTVRAGAAHVISAYKAPFSTPKLCCIDEDGYLYTVASAASATSIGAAVTPVAPLSYHRGKLIITAGDGTTAPKYYDGTTLGDLAGTPPAGRLSAVYKDMTVLASTAAQKQRIYYSGFGDPTSWDTSNAYQDADWDLTGLAALEGMIILFGSAAMARVRGATPPPGSDMRIDSLWSVGCADARSIATVDSTVVFASLQGLYQTDGAALSDLTKLGGMKQYWVDLLSGYTSTWTIAGGVFRNEYICSVMDGSTFKDAFRVDLPSRSWTRLTNVKATAFHADSEGAAELYAGLRDRPYLAEMSSIWTPAAAVKADGDGTAVAMTVETPFYTMPKGKGTWRSVYLRYDLRDAATDNPTFTPSYVTSPEATSYTEIKTRAGASYPMGETTAEARVRRDLDVAAMGVGFKLAQANAAAVGKLYAIDVEGQSWEGTRV